MRELKCANPNSETDLQEVATQVEVDDSRPPHGWPESANPGNALDVTETMLMIVSASESSDVVGYGK